jgi:hypothetical protein
MTPKLLLLAALLGLAVIAVAQEVRKFHLNVVYQDVPVALSPVGTDRVYLIEDPETGTRCYAIHEAISCVKK